MDFRLTEEQKQIKSLVRDFCTRGIDIKHLDGLAERAARATTVEELRSFQPWDLMDKLYDTGLRQLAVPVEYDGGGADILTCSIAEEEAGYSGGPAARFIGLPWMNCLHMARGPYISPKQKEWFFEKFMSDKHLFLAGNFSEPSGATDIHTGYDEPGVAMKTMARKDGNEWVINGDKMFSSGSGISDLIMVSARTDKTGPISRSMSLFWVKRGQPGHTQEMNRLMSADISGNCQNHYDNVRVPEEQVVGEINKGYMHLQYILAVKLIHHAGRLGVAQKLYEQIRDYAKERVQGGRPIIKHPNIEAMLGSVALHIDACRAYIHKASWEYDEFAKHRNTELTNLYWGLGCYYLRKKVWLELAEVASEIYGGIGGSLDMPLDKFVRGLYLYLPGGSTANMNSIECCRYYDDRYLEEYL